jgi:hypothetical protein
MLISGVMPMPPTMPTKPAASGFRSIEKTP